MSVAIENIGFSSREEAVKLAESEGFFFRDGAMGTGNLEDIHWHKTGLHIYVLSGMFETLDAIKNEVLIAKCGDLNLNLDFSTSITHYIIHLNLYKHPCKRANSIDFSNQIIILILIDQHPCKLLQGLRGLLSR